MRGGAANDNMVGGQSWVFFNDNVITGGKDRRLGFLERPMIDQFDEVFKGTSTRMSLQVYMNQMNRNCDI